MMFCQYYLHYLMWEIGTVPLEMLTDDLFLFVFPLLATNVVLFLLNLAPTAPTFACSFVTHG